MSKVDPSELLERLIAREDLSQIEAHGLLAEMMGGSVTDIQIAAILVALRSKGEVASELAGFARAMRERVAAVNVNRSQLIDTAGTGGGLTTFNVSTTAALIAASAGCYVAKHGNRSATGRSGSADLLQALGVQIELTPGQVAHCIDTIGFGFMFAPLHHAATRTVTPIRQELAVRTIFNFLGPLTNPAAAKRQLVGVADRSMLEPMAYALLELGAERALVVHGVEGLDEVSASGKTAVYEVADSTVQFYEIEAKNLGVCTVSSRQLQAGGPAENAAITRRVFAGKDIPERSLALVNAGVAIYLGGRSQSIADGVQVATEVVDSGKAASLLDRYVALTSKLSART